MATVCETPRTKATHGNTRTRGYDFAFTATDACALIASGDWPAVMSVATGFDMQDAAPMTDAENIQHMRIMHARFGR